MVGGGTLGWLLLLIQGSDALVPAIGIPSTPRALHASRTAPPLCVASTDLQPPPPASDLEARGAEVTNGLRAVHLGAAAGAMLVPELMDGAVATLWSAIDSQPFVHNCMFEATLAVAAFVLWIFLFESVHKVLPDAHTYRFDGKPPVRPLWGFTREWHKSVVPAAAYLGSIAVFHALHLGPMLFGLKPAFDEAPSFVRLITEVSLGIFLYDALFYPFHYSFHKLRSGQWRKLHSRHHQWGATEDAPHNAIETVQNSYVDSGVQVFINICVQQFSPWGYKHPLSRIFHNLMVTYLLCESHSGYDLPFMSHRLFPTVFGGAPRHEAHHQRGNVYFHQFFMWIDDALGTVQKEPLPAPLTSHVSELEGSWAGSRVRSPSAARAATAASSANAEAAEGLSQPS